MRSRKCVAGPRRRQRGKGMAQMQIAGWRWRKACHTHSRQSNRFFRNNGFAFSFRPAPCARCRARPRHLVVLVHGYGSDGNDLIGLAPHWQEHAAGRRLRRAQCARSGARLARLSMVSHRPHRSAGNAARAWKAPRPCWTNFWTPNWRACRLPPERLILVGFSQGTMLSLHVGLRRAVPPAAIVGFSGLLAGAAARHAPTARRFFWPMAMPIR